MSKSFIADVMSSKFIPRYFSHCSVDSFSESSFKEDISEAQWNYDRYFISGFESGERIFNKVKIRQTLK